MPVVLPTRSLRVRLLFFLTAVFALLFAGLLHEHADGERQAREKALARATDLARGYMHQYDRLLRERLTVLETLLRMPGFDVDDLARCEETLRHIVATDPSLVNIVLLDGQNRVLCAGRPGSVTDAGAATVRRALESRDVMVGMSGTDGQVRAYLTLARAIVDGGGAVRGALLAYLDRDWLNARFAETVPAGVVLRIFDGDGVFVVRQPDPACCVGKSGLKLGGIGEALAGGREQARKSLWMDGVERLQADLPLAAPLAGVVSIGIPEDQVLSDTDRAKGKFIWLLSGLFLALYGLSWLLSDRYILRPLRALSEGARRLRQGELSFRIPDGVGSDEFARLRQDFNEMADNLDAREEEIRRDMEKLAASERALRESESRFRSLYEQAPLAHQSLDATGTLLDVNAAWCELFGTTREEALGRSFSEFLSEASCELFGERFDRFRREGRTEGNIFEIVRADGAKRLVEANGRIARDAEGDFLRTHCVLSDVTERRENELRLRLAASVFEQAHEAITITDDRATILAVSRRFTAITGYRADEAIGQNPRILQSGRQDAAFYRAMWDALKGAGHWSGEIWNRRKDGTVFPEWLSISAVRDEDGRATNYVAVFTDLTEQKAAEEALRRANDELEQRVAERTEALQDAIRELEAFSYSVSHDLRAPLRAINGFSHLLEDEYGAGLDDKARGYLARVRAGSVKMGKLIDDLHELSQVSRQPMRFEDVDLSQLAAEIAAELAEAEPGRAVEWSIATGVAATCDAGLIRAVLANLLGNAWKYTAKREVARIAFGVEAGSGEPVYYVRDNGAGFDMKFADKLFGAFQRLHTPAEFPGSGIGLATVARIVHRHGGRVWGEGRPGEGAAFLFTLRSRSGPGII